MAIHIGEKAAESFLSHPLGLFYSCHRRVEHFLSDLMAITHAAQGGTLNEGQRRALESALRYFREAAPKHTLDEEASLFPRMQRVQGLKMQPVLDKIEALKRGHRESDADHQQVDAYVQQWLEQGPLPKKAAQALSEALNRLSDFYQTHIQMEETKIFPLAEKMLDASAIEAIGREMAVRRGLDPDALKQLTEELKLSSHRA